MQLSNVLAILTFALNAVAAPNRALEVRGGTQPSCSVTGQKNVCCTGLLGLLNCIVSVAGANCGGEAYCCSGVNDETCSPTLIDLNLSCIRVL